MRPHSLAAWLFVITLSLAVPTRAQEPAEAQASYRAGIALYKEGHYPQALAKFLAARRLWASGRVDFNIGSTLQMMGEMARAADYYERVLAPGEPGTAKFAALSRERLTSLRPTLAKLVLQCSTAAEVLVNGTSRGEIAAGGSFYAAPGAVQLVVRRAGQPDFAVTLQVKAGAETKVVVAGAQAAPPSEPPRAAGSSAAQTAAVLQDAELSRQAAARRKQTLWAYTTLGVGAAFIAGAAVCYGVGGAQGRDAYERHKDDPADQAAREDVKSARVKMIIADVLVGAGAVALGTSIYLFLKRSRAAEAPRNGSLALVPGALGATLVGQF